MMGKELSNAATTALVVVSMLIGAGIGSLSDATGDRLEGLIDVTVLALIIILIVDIRLIALPREVGVRRFLAVALGTNFLIIPAIGFAIASLGFPDNAPVATGLAIYFMAPCTDWFLGFTRLARGNVTLGAALLPINLAVQLVLTPLYLSLFAGRRGDIELSIGDTLLDWFVLPFAIALAVRLLLRLLRPDTAERITAGIASLTPWVLALLIVAIFAANVAVLGAHLTLFARVLGLVFVFFVVTYLLGEAIARRCRFAYPEHALFTMTTAARNAPLMLGLTAAIAPDEPLLAAAIVAGMLVEFPHLTLLKHLLLRRRRRLSPPAAGRVAAHLPGWGTQGVDS